MLQLLLASLQIPYCTGSLRYPLPPVSLPRKGLKALRRHSRARREHQRETGAAPDHGQRPQPLPHAAARPGQGAVGGRSQPGHAHAHKEMASSCGSNSHVWSSVSPGSGSTAGITWGVKRVEKNTSSDSPTAKGNTSSYRASCTGCCIVASAWICQIWPSGRKSWVCTASCICEAVNPRLSSSPVYQACAKGLSYCGKIRATASTYRPGERFADSSSISPGRMRLRTYGKKVR